MQAQYELSLRAPRDSLQIPGRGVRTESSPGSFPAIPFQVSSFGMIPKCHQQNKWHLIVDLYSTDGCSVNDRIDLLAQLHVSEGDIAVSIFHHGRGVMIAKTDVKQPYHQIPVHPQDRHLLGMRWQGSPFADLWALLCIAYFSAVADALEWIERSRGATNIFHYTDDFIMVVPPQLEACELSLHMLTHMLGMPITHEKTEGPATRHTVLVSSSICQLWR